MRNVSKLILAAALACQAFISSAFAGPPEQLLKDADLSAEGDAAPDGWEVTVGVPAWAVGMNGDIGLKGLGPFAFDKPTSEVFSNLDMAASLSLEVRKSRWGVLLDGLYLRVRDNAENPDPLLSTVDVQVEQFLAETAVTCRVLEWEHGWLDLLAGARLIHLAGELDLSLDPAGVSHVSATEAESIVSKAVAEARRQAAGALAAARESGALRQAAVERVIQTEAFNRIAQTVRNLTDDERSTLREKLAANKPLLAARADLARATLEERAAGTVASARATARRKISAAERKLASAIESAIRDAVPAHVSASKTWIDPFVGFRARHEIAHPLYLTARGDIGGFGVGSDLSWNLHGALGVQCTRHLAVELGYRILDIDYADSDFSLDASTRGFLLGLLWTF